MLMQWFVNEVREKFAEIDKKLKEIRPNDDSRLTKLEGEIKAMKARMGKKQD